MRHDGYFRRCWPILAVLCCAAAACSRDRSNTDTLVVGLESMPTNLDPRFATDAASARIDDLVFRSLTRLDEHQRHEPDLAVEWRAETPLRIRFRLRPDARFSDGRPLTAADVRATYESILDPNTASPKRGDLAFLEAVDAPDDHTVTFRLREPFAPFLEATTIGILPRASAAKSDELIGAGPYRIERIRPGQEVLLVRGDAIGIPRIRFRTIPDDTVRTLELDQGTVGLVENAVEPDNLGWLVRRDRVCVQRIPGTTFQYLGLNFADPRLRDRRVRRAIAHALDRRSLVDHLLAGFARPATGLLPPEHWAYEGDVRRYDYDPAAAKRLLDEAGYLDPDGDGPATRFTVSYETTTLDSRRRIGEALQAMLRDVGIGVAVRSFEWGTFYDDVRHGRFELYSLAWVGITDPDFFFRLLHSTMTPPRGTNRGAYADAAIDRLVILGRRTLDPADRRAVYAEIQRRTAEELPFIPLWWTDNVVVTTKRLCGFVPYPDGSLVSLSTAWLSTATSGAAGPCGCEPVR